MNKLEQLHFGKSQQYNSDRLKNKLKYLIRTNKWHCSAKPIYGLDLHACIGNDKIITTLNSSNNYATCQQAFKYELQTNKCMYNDFLIFNQNIVNFKKCL